jgi:hypothetical protein
VLLVGRGTPAAVDDELDPVVRGIGRGFAQGSEQIGVEVGYTRNVVVEDRRAVGDSAVGLAKGITEPAGATKVLTARTAVVPGKNVDG